MGIFDLFSKKNPGGNRPSPAEVPFLGGNGSTPDEAIEPNCASVGMAHSMISRYVSERHGREGVDWEKSISASIVRPSDDRRVQRMIFKLSTDQTVAYFFDLSRQARNTAAMLGLDELK